MAALRSFSLIILALLELGIWIRVTRMLVASSEIRQILIVRNVLLQNLDLTGGFGLFVSDFSSIRLVGVIVFLDDLQLDVGCLNLRIRLIQIEFA